MRLTPVPSSSRGDEELLDGLRVAGAWEEHPTWALLRSHNVRWVLPLFSRHLENADGPVSADWFHQKVAEALAVEAEDADDGDEDEGGEGGDDAGPRRSSPADYCRSWVDARWLVRTRPSGREGRAEYRLSQHSLQALRIVRELVEQDSAVSEARFGSIAHAVHQLAAMTDPDADAQLGRIDEQIAELQRRRAAIVADGVEPAEAEAVRRQVREVLRLTASLPEDFRRLSAMVEERHREVARRASEDGIGKGALVDQYLRDNDLLEQTPEGRAYRGFAATLSSHELDAVRLDLERVLRQPGAVDQLTERQYAQLETLIASLLAEEQGVQETYVRWMSSLRRLLSRSAPARQQRLLSLAERAIAAGAEWTDRSPGPASVPGDVLGLAPWALTDVSQAQLWRDDGREELGVDVAEHEEPLPDSERAALRLAVGTAPAAVQETIDRLLAARAEATAADVYEATPEEYRRLGLAVSLLDRAAELGAFAEGEEAVRIRPGGEHEREVVLPRMVFRAETAAAETTSAETTRETDEG